MLISVGFFKTIWVDSLMIFNVILVWDQVCGPQDDQLEYGFQLKSIYGQLMFLLNLIFVSTPKIAVHNRVPSNNCTIEELGHSWVLFFNKGLARHLIIGETLHFQGLNMDMTFKSQWTKFTKRMVDKGFCVSSDKIGSQEKLFAIEQLPFFFRILYYFCKAFHNRAPRQLIGT